MTPERWRQIEAAYQSAMEREPDSRDACLVEACGNDEELRREVESLLKLNSSPVLIDQPVWHAADELLDNNSIVAAGTQLGPYRIEGVLGAGGMGQVYRARDTRLDRLVAIKVSREEFNERFEREARAVAALNHPNICTLHDVGPNYLVMELVEGSTLAERIKEGAIPLEEALRIAGQIADALEAAHERGIIHRDLKPGNIKVKTDGTVKVLDFGLAKRHSAEGAVDLKPEDSPTISAAATRAGVILGTAAYMSPEQARGHGVDKRADIWAFGVVLYEMITGQQLFEGATVTDTLASVLTKEPEWSKAPYEVRRLLQACLDRDLNSRLRDVADVWRLLDAPHAEPARHSNLAAAVAVASALIAGWALWSWWNAPRPSEESLVHLEVDLGPSITLGSPGGPTAILSPDGTRLAFISAGRLFTRRLNQPKAVELVGTEGAYAPFFSPDGQWVAFFAQSILKKVPVDGGSLIALSDTSARRLAPGDAGFARGGSWGEDGAIIASLGETSTLARIPSAGGAPTAITEFDTTRRERTHRWPQILPRGKGVLFTAHTNAGVGFDGANLLVVSPGELRAKVILSGGTFGRYLPSGHLVYLNKGTLFAVPFDLDGLRVRGTPAPVLEHVAYSVQNGSAQIDFSKTGRVVYRAGGASGLLTLQWVDGAGTMKPLWNKPGEYLMPRLSQDGRRVALSVEEGSNADIWVYDWQRETSSRVTFGGGVRIHPLWSPDGEYIIFAERAGRENIYWTRADGSGTPELLVDKAGQQTPIPWSFTPNGKRLAFTERTAGSGNDIWTVPIEAGERGLRAGKPELFLQTPFEEFAAAFSPDGRWIAYHSNESGALEVYVVGFPDRRGKRRVSNSGGAFPSWSRAGRELLFRAKDGRIMVAEYTLSGDAFIPQKPRVWSDRRLRAAETGFFARDFDVAPDGKRVVAFMPADAPDEMAPNHVVFLENFFDELRRRTQPR